VTPLAGESNPLGRAAGGLLVFAAIVVALLSILPTLRLATAGLIPDGALSVERIAAILGGRTVIRAALGTLETAIASSILALAVGTAMALAVAATDAAGRRAAAFLFVLSTMVSPQVTALAFLNLAGPASPLLNSLGLAPAPGTPNPFLGRDGVIVVLGLHHAPLVFVVLVAGLKRIPRAVIDAASIDGASAARIVGGILIPLLRPHLLGAGLLAFVAGLGNFGIPALLGLPVNYLTLPTLIYRRLSSFGSGVIGDVALLGTLVALIAIVCVLASTALTRRQEVGLEEDGSFQPFWSLGPNRFAVSVAMHAVNGLVLGLPLLSLAAAALVPSYGMALSFASATLDNFAEVLLRQEVTRRAFANSLLLAGGSAVVLGCLALPLAYGLVRRPGRLARWLTVLVEIPYVLPGIVLAIACILLFLRPLPVLGLSLYATPWIILFAYLARFLAVALKPAIAAMTQFDPAQEEAAALDGAGLLRRIRDVVAPSLLPSALAGAVLAFLLAFNELTVSALLWSAGTETLGVVLFSLEEAGLASQAAAVALTTVVVIALVMLAVDALGRHLPPGALPWRPWVER
jgi:iron(III) transport system permease protein